MRGQPANLQFSQKVVPALKRTEHGDSRASAIASRRESIKLYDEISEINPT